MQTDIRTFKQSIKLLLGIALWILLVWGVIILVAWITF
jgi:hypothetical protein